MKVKASQILAVHNKYIGVKENPPNTNNVIFNTKYYGREVQDTATTKYPWCVVYQWYIFNELNANDIFCDGVKTASCGYVRNHAINSGRWINNPKDLKFGDLSIFDWENDGNLDTDHIGFVESNDGVLHTIEGNTGIGNDSNGGEVMRRDRNYVSCIGGYRPDYLPEGEVKKEDVAGRFARITDIPNGWDSTGAPRSIIEKLMNAGIIGGDGSDPIGNNDIIDLSMDQIRTFVVMYRGGAFDRKFKKLGMAPAVPD